MDNYQIADQFSLLSKLMDIHGENSFKSKSYSIAAYNIEQLSHPLEETPRTAIAGLRGIGDSTSKKIVEILDSGKLSALEDLIRKTPTGVLQMLQIKGLGPKKIATVWKEMGIESIGELLYACQENRLLLFKGFGEKTQQNVREAIEYFLRHQGQFLYAEMETLARGFQQGLEQDFAEGKTAMTGAFARQSLTIDQLEWVTTVPLDSLQSWLAKKGMTDFVINGQTLSCVAEGLVTLRFHHTPAVFFGRTLFEKTGSTDFMEAWLEHGLTVPDADSEDAFFKLLGVQWMPPALRETGLFINAAKRLSVPELIQAKDIKGIVHAHSTWSDGSNTLEEMAVACIEQGFEYLVISDHSRSAFYARGLTEERVREQQALIRELNLKLQPFRIFSSIECDILGDGSMDYPDEVLASFDLVIASIHSNLKMSPEKAMQRLLGAIRNPYTTILGHPTGRLLLSREGYPIDHSAMIDACIENKVAIEINAHPRRLDLDWKWIPEALSKGAHLSIDPDAHAVEGYADIRYGVLAAQKGGLTKNHNLSSFTRSELENYLASRSTRGNRR
jgi:DNA polymerase (family 10)